MVFFLLVCLPQWTDENNQTNEMSAAELDGQV